jgi:hypothetical protein
MVTGVYIKQKNGEHYKFQLTGQDIQRLGSGFQEWIMSHNPLPESEYIITTDTKAYVYRVKPINPEVEVVRVK